MATKQIRMEEDRAEKVVKLADLLGRPVAKLMDDIAGPEIDRRYEAHRDRIEAMEAIRAGGVGRVLGGEG